MAHLTMAGRGWVAGTVLGLVGCTGVVGEPRPGSSSEPPGAGGSTTVGPTETPTCAIPRAPLRRLTRFDYNNTVRDLLGIASKPASALPGEEVGNGFGNDADQLGVSALLIDGYRSIAQDMAKGLTPDAAAANTLVGCDLASGAACLDGFLQSFGARAYRRPLAEADLDALRAAYAKGVELGGTPQKGLQAVLEVLLQSPQFLYRLEQGVAQADGSARPSSFEMATRLSYLFWGSLPDQPLRDAAAQDALTTAEQVKAQAERLLADPRARDVLRYFHGQLLGTLGLDGLVRNAEYYPTFQPGMGRLFREETEAFVDHVMWQGSATFSELFTAPYTFLNGPLSQFYGFGGVPAEQQEFVKVDFVDPALKARRGGLLTQASILSMTTPGSRTNPIVRGKWLLDKVLCMHVPDPPPGLMVEEPEVTPGTTARQRFSEHREKEPCKSCHTNLDPVGFGFENYDGVGLWRDTDNGLPIDNLGEIAASDLTGQFRGPLELGQKAAASTHAKLCFTSRWLTYAYGRQINEADACTRKAVEDVFIASSGDVKQLLVALTQTDAFLKRPVVVAGQ